MKLFESIESKWEHHCDAGMPELLNFLAQADDRVVTTKRELYEEVNRRVPYKGVVISERQIQKNLDLLFELHVISKEVIGEKRNAKTIYTRGTGRGVPKKKDEIDFDMLLQWYNQHIAVGGRAKWLKVTAKEKANIRKCQTIANERKATIGSTLSKVTASTFLMGWKGLGHYWIFQEDNFIKILDGNYDNNNRTTGSTTPSLFDGLNIAGQSADIADEAAKSFGDRIASARKKCDSQ